MNWGIFSAVAALGAVWVTLAFIRHRTYKRNYRCWENTHSEWRDLREEWRLAKESIAKELITHERAASFEGALAKYRTAKCAWDAYDEATTPNYGWFGDDYIDYSEPHPPPPTTPRPGLEPALKDYVDWDQVEAVFNKRRGSHELAVPDLAPEPQPPIDQWYDRPALASTVTLACLVVAAGMMSSH